MHKRNRWIFNLAARRTSAAPHLILIISRGTTKYIGKHNGSNRRLETSKIERQHRAYIAKEGTSERLVLVVAREGASLRQVLDSW